MQFLAIYWEWVLRMIEKFVALDIETTGLNPAEDKIIEIGMAKVEQGRIVSQYDMLINPRLTLSPRICDLTKITQDMLVNQPSIEEIIGEVIEFIGDAPILGHNIIFDYSFIKKAAVNQHKTFEKQGIDTLKLARRLLPEVPHKNLEYLCQYFQIDAGNSHRAYDDAVSAMQVFYRLHELHPEDAGFDELIALNYNVKKDSPITPAQKRYLTALLAMHGISFTEDIDALTKSRASKVIDSIISQYGR